MLDCIKHKSNIFALNRFYFSAILIKVHEDSHLPKSGFLNREVQEVLFTSLEFVFLFLPVVLAIHFILPQRVRNYWLMAASLFFYGWGEPSFLFVMIASILFNYFSAWKMADLREAGNEAYCKFTLFFAISVNLLLLFCYKYMNFVTAILLNYFPSSASWVTETSFILPIGISFFTFQAISYLIDVYRGTKVQKNLGKVALYISLFPQLIAGPIVRYDTIAGEIEHREITSDKFAKGVLRFMRGFNKKVLLSNILAVVADASWDMSERTVVMAWLGALCYSLQIFFDFSGYSDMAIGLGQMFGFTFLENFNYPYISRTISEFWRRWHISLSSWFRDYVYFPLGGSRVKTKRRLVFNLCVVWILTGIWHGAAWTFVAWGCLYAIFICAEKLLDMERRLKGHWFFGLCYRVFTLLIVMFLWVLFRSDKLRIAWYYWKDMLWLHGNDFINPETRFYLREYRIALVIACLCSTPVFRTLKGLAAKRGDGFSELADGVSGIIHLLLFIVSISYLVMNAHNPFIYFNF